MSKLYERKVVQNSVNNDILKKLAGEKYLPKKRPPPMCAINPTHKRRIIFDFYTSVRISKKEFDDIIYSLVQETEMAMNDTGVIRVHAKDTNQEAD